MAQSTSIAVTPLTASAAIRSPGKRCRKSFTQRRQSPSFSLENSYRNGSAPSRLPEKAAKKLSLRWIRGMTLWMRSVKKAIFR